MKFHINYTLAILVSLAFIPAYHCTEQKFAKSNRVTKAGENAHLIKTRGGDHSRSKRDVPSEADEQRYLDKHNELRRLEGAADMYKLTWNDELASMASIWADTCVWEHGQPENTSPYGSLGQNLYAASGSTVDIEGAIQAWYDEIEDYTFSTLTCAEGAVCGHYTQVVWAESMEVGCAVAICEAIDGLDWGGVNMVCNYGPAGNFNGAAPYTLGTGCTKCSSGTFYCDDGLCNDECTAAGDGCECAANCRNCGTETADCTCDCAAGWTDIDCSATCENTEENCGANPGWPVSWCTDEYQYVLDGCPLMCGLCEAADENTPECEETETPTPTPADASEG